MWLNENSFSNLISSTYIDGFPYPMTPPRLTDEDKIRYAEDDYPYIESDCCRFFSDCCYGRSKTKSANHSRNNLLHMFSKSRGVNIDKRLGDLNLVYENTPHQNERKEFSYHTLRFLYLYASLHQNKSAIKRIERSITEYNRRNHSEKWFINLNSLRFTTNDHYLLHNQTPILNLSSVKSLYDLQHPGAALYLARYYNRKITQQSGISMQSRSSFPSTTLLCQVTPFYRQAIQWGLTEARPELLDFLLTTEQYDEAVQQYLACPKAVQDQVTEKMKPLIVSRQKIIHECHAPKALFAPLSTTPSIPVALLLSESTIWKLLQKLDPFYFQEQNVMHILSALPPKDKHDCDFMNRLVSSKGRHNDATSIIMLELHEHLRNKTIKHVQAISKGICNPILNRLRSNSSMAIANAIYLFNEEDDISFIPFIYNPDEQGWPIINLSPDFPRISLHTLDKYTSLTKDNNRYRIYSKAIEEWGANLYDPSKSIIYKAYNTRNVDLPLLQKLVHLRYFGHPEFLEQHHIQPFHYRFLEEIAALPTAKLKIAFSTKNIHELCYVLRPSQLINDEVGEQKTTAHSQKETSPLQGETPLSIELISVKH